MVFEYFSKNGTVLPISEAVVPLSDIGYAYGFGVYETIRVVDGNPRFLSDHTERLIESARIIGLEHSFDAVRVGEWVQEIAHKTETSAFNIKILLIGGATKEDAVLYMLPLNPLFPDKKLYRDGVSVTTYQHERAFPHAKTLDMFHSYIAYRDAKKADAYDALFIDRNGNVLEGTRTNFLCLKGTTLSIPDPEKVLAGVTQKNLLKAAQDAGFDVRIHEIPLSDISNYDCAMLTSTSSGVLRISSVDRVAIGTSTAEFEKLSNAFEEYVQRHASA